MPDLFQKDNNTFRRTVGWAAAGVGLFVVASRLYNELTKYPLKDKVVLITGGARGLGLVLARHLTAKGAKIALCARTSEQVAEAKSELQNLGPSVLALTVDVTDPLQVNTLVEDVINHYGRLDVVINNAGIVQVGPQESMVIKDYEEAMKTHFYAPLYVIRAVVPKFIDQGEGRIVNITSIGGKIAMPHLLPYSASKFALVGLSEGMHAELKKYNIHVTTIVPNLMRTGSPRNITVKGDHEAEYAWFKWSDSFPLLSQGVDLSARNIIRAIEYGDAEAVLTWTAKIATLIQGFAPGWVNALLTFTNRFLPENTEEGHIPKKGYEAESQRSQGRIPSITDYQAVRNNEL